MSGGALTRRAFVGRCGVAGVGLLTGASISVHRTTAIASREVGTTVGMSGVDAANTGWIPGPLPDGMPEPGERLFPGVTFSRGLTEEAGLLYQGGVLYAKGRTDDGGSILFAIDGVTGEERWRSVGVDALVALTSDAAICSRLGRDGAADVVVAIALADPHEELWSVEARPQGRTVVSNGNVLISASDGLLQLDAGSGLVVWDHRGEDLPRHFEVAVAGDVIVGTIPTESERVHAWRLDTGEPLWEVAFDRPIQTAPVFDGETVLVCDPLELIELDSGTGVEINRVEHGWAMPYMGTIMLAEGLAIVWDTGGARAIERATSELIWEYTPFYGMASGNRLCAGDTLFVLTEGGAELDDGKVIEAIDISTGEPRYELPSRQDDAPGEGVRQFLVADGRVYLAVTDGLHLCEGVGAPYSGVTTPVQGNSMVGVESGFSYSWSDEWEPGQTSWFLGEDGLQLHSRDERALVTQYVQQMDEPMSPEAVAWSIAGVPAAGASSTLDPAPIVVAFPRTFGTDTSRLVSLEGFAPPDLSGAVPHDAGVAQVIAHTVLAPPFDRMVCLIVTVPLSDPSSMLVFEFATAELEFDARLSTFLSFFGELKVE